MNLWHRVARSVSELVRPLHDGSELKRRPERTRPWQGLQSLEPRLLLSGELPPFLAVQPYGTSVYHTELQDDLAESESAPWTVDLEAQQTLALRVQPLDGSLDLSVTLRDEAGHHLASIDAGLAGVAEVLPLAVIPAAGTYTIEVEAQSGLGRYDLDAWVNAIVGNPRDGGSLETAKPLEGGFIPLPGGGSRAAIIDAWRSGLIDNQGFEFGLDGDWQLESWSSDTDAGGEPVDPARQEVSSDFGAALGQYALVQSRSDAQEGATLNQATWTVDLAGRTNVSLSFAHLDLGDAEDPFPGAFLDRVEADGIAISVDGSSWHPVWTPGDQADGVWQTHSIDLTAAAAAAGVSLDGAVQIRLQQYGPGDAQTLSGGRAWDDLRLTTADAFPSSGRYYRVELAEGQRIAAAVSSPDHGQIGMALYDAAGEMMVLGDGARANYADAIAPFAAPADGSYFVVVGSLLGPTHGTDLNLVVTIDAALEAEGSDPEADAAGDLSQPLLGSVGLTRTDRLFLSMDQDDNSLVELVPQTLSPVREVSFVSANYTSWYRARADTTADMLVWPELKHRGYRAFFTPLRDLEATFPELARYFDVPSPVFVTWGEELIVMRGTDGTTREYQVHDAQSGEVLRTLTIADDGQLFGSAVGLLSLGDDGRISRADPQTGDLTPLDLPVLEGDIRHVASIGHELFVIRHNPEQATVDVYDLHTLDFKRSEQFPVGEYRSGGGFSPYYYALGGGGGGMDIDRHQVRATAGDVITVATRTPWDSTMNRLDPAIEVYDPAGNLIASDDNGLFDGRNARLEFTAPVSGAYELVIRAVGGTRGEYLLHVDGATTEVAAFEVTSVDPPDGARLDTVPQQITLQFSQDLALTSVDASDLMIDGNPAIGFTIVDNRTVTFDLLPQGLGRFELRLDAGAITDSQGRPVEAMHSELFISGRALLPAGSLAYSHQTVGDLTAAHSEHMIPYHLDPGQRLSFAMRPDSMLQPVVELLDPSGAVLASATADAAGAVILVQGTPIDVGGVYQLRVTGAGGTLGSYTVDVLLNASFEEESHGGPSNDGAGQAESLDGRFVDLAGGGDISTVVGVMEGDDREVLYAEDFESGSLGAAWDPSSEDRPRNDVSAASGSYAMFQWNPNSNGGPDHDQAIWTVDLAGQSNLILEFAYAAIRDGGDLFSGPYEGTANADGISISVDGETWHPVWTAPWRWESGWEYFALDLDRAASEAGIVLSDQTRIKFQMYGGYNFGADPPDYWLGWDDLSIFVPQSRDQYAVPVSTDESVSVYLRGRSDDPVAFRVLDSDGELVGLSSAVVGNVDHLLEGLTAATPDQYVIEVIGSGHALYDLVVTREAALSVEPNNALDAAQDITDTGVAVGAVGYDMGRLFGVRRVSTSYMIMEFDPVDGELVNSFEWGHAKIARLATTPDTLLIVAESLEQSGEYWIYELDPDDGRIIREFAVPQMNSVFGLAYQADEIYCGGYIGEGFGSESGWLVLDYHTGRAKRQFSAELRSGGSSSAVGASGGLVYTTDGSLTALDTSSGEERALVRNAEIVSGTTAAVGDELFVTWGGGIRVYDRYTGELSRSLDLDSSYADNTRLGGDASFGEDWYRIEVEAGDVLNISTRLPGGGPLMFHNVVDPVLELYDPAGTLVALADNNHADGRNARLTYETTSSGTYYVRVFATGLGGEYVVHVDGHTGGASGSFAATADSPVEGATVEGVPRYATISFNRPIDLRTVSADDLQVDGVDAVGVTWVDGRTVRFELPSLIAGRHVMTMAQGAVGDLAGRPVAAFSSDFETPVETVAVRPLGGMIYRQQVAGRVSDIGERAFTRLEIDGGQTLSVLVVATGDEGLRPSIRLIDMDGREVGHALAPVGHDEAVIQTVSVPTGGSYRLEVAGADGTTGDFRVELVLNAAINTQAENLSPEQAHSEAQPIDEAFLDLGDGAARAGLVGRIVPETDGELIAFDGFESGSLGLDWTAWQEGTGDEQGEILVTDAYGAYEGDRSLRIKPNGYSSAPSLLAEATWTLDLSSISQPVLSFVYRSGVVPYSFDGPFTGHANASGVAISVDGVNWQPIWQADRSLDWNQVRIDLTTAAPTLDLQGTVQLRFQAYGRVGSNGYAGHELDFDAIAVRSRAAHWYRFAGEAGQKISVAGEASGSHYAIDLLNEAGNALASSDTSAENLDALIRDLPLPADGTYYLRVTGAVEQDYAAVITRDAAFDAEQNNRRADAISLDETRVAIGDLGRMQGRLFVYSGTNTLYEIDPSTGRIVNSIPSPVDYDHPDAAIALDGGTLIVGSDLGRIVQIDRVTGEVIREFEPLESDVATLAVADGELFAVGMATPQRLDVYDLDTGLRVRQVNLPRWVDEIAGDADSLYNRNGSYVWQIDTATGEMELLGQIELSDPNYGDNSAIVDGELIVYAQEHESSSYWYSFKAYDVATLQLQRSWVDAEWIDPRGLAGGAGNVYDQYRIDLSRGEVLTVSTATPGDGPGLFENGLDPAVEIYDPHGALIVTDDNGASDGRNAHLRFAAREDGTFYIRVLPVAGTQGEYVLSTDVAEPADVSMWPAEVYPVDGQTLDGDLPSVTVEFSHAIDPATLESADLQMDGQPAAEVTLIDPYTVRFTPSIPFVGGAHAWSIPAGAISSIWGTTHEAVTGHFNFEPYPLTYQSTIADGTVYWDQFPATLRFDFSNPFVAAPSADVLTINGAAATAVSVIDEDSLSFALPADLPEGSYTLALEAAAVEDPYGQASEPWTAEVIYEHAPRLIASDAVVRQSVPADPLLVTLQFDHALDAAALDPAGVVLESGGQAYPSDELSYDPATFTVTARFSDVPEGLYTLRVVSGAGGIRSAVGLDFDGEPHAAPDALLPSGDGVPGGDFVAELEVDVTTQPVPAPDELRPFGRSLYRGSWDGLLRQSGDTDAFTLELSEGQRVSVLIESAPDLRAVAQLIGPTGQIRYAADAAQPGEPLLLQSLAVDETGLHTLEIAGTDADTGAYTVTVLNNAAFEAESIQNVTNNVPADAQSLDPGFITDGSGVEQTAVVGDLTAAGYQTYFSEDFETGQLSPAWQTYSSDSRGRISLTPPSSGRRGTSDRAALYMDRDESGSMTLNEAIWTVNLSGVSDPVLTFRHRSFGDENHLLPSSFVDHAYGDGVAVSVDGVHWHTVHQAGSDFDWVLHEVDLEALASQAGLSLEGPVMIKFQQYDNYPMTSDGRGWDDIRIVGLAPGVDWYRVAAQAGELLTVEVSHPVGPDGGITLHDADGLELASGVVGDGHAALEIAAHPIDADGAYYVAVRGALPDYSLVVQRALEPTTPAAVTMPTDSASEPTASAAEQPQAEPRVWEPLSATPGLSYLTHVHGTISASFTAAQSTLQLGAGHTLTATVEAAEIDAALVVELIDPTGRVVASAIGDEGLDRVRIRDAGEFTLRITSDRPTSFTAELLLNTAVESIDTADAAEQWLEPQYLRPETPWWAVRGRLDPIVTVDEYEIDLAPGQPHQLDITLTGLEGALVSDLQVHLISPDGMSVRASSLPDPLNWQSTTFDQAIFAAVVDQGGRWTLRISGRGHGQYVLQVSDRTVQGASPAGTTRSLDLASNAVGRLDGTGGDVVDRYTVHLEAGELLSVYTDLPMRGAATGVPDDLVLELSIHNAEGDLLARNLEGLGGGNAAAHLLASETGVYTVAVAADAGRGEYVMHSEISWGAAVMSRRLFYNASRFDGADAQANPADDSAIDLTKRPVPSAGSPTPAGHSTYDSGLNGIMIDVAGLPVTPNAEDFRFRFGNSDDPATWPDAPAPIDLALREGEGELGSDRVTVLWPDQVMRNGWLEVVVLSDDNGGRLGLTDDDVFYFGHLAGDGDGDGTVDADDVTGSIGHMRDGLDPADIANAYDHNRDGLVNVQDMLVARANLGASLAMLATPEATGADAVAPEADEPVAGETGAQTRSADSGVDLLSEQPTVAAYSAALLRAARSTSDASATTPAWTPLTLVEDEPDNIDDVVDRLRQ